MRAQRDRPRKPRRSPARRLRAAARGARPPEGVQLGPFNQLTTDELAELEAAGGRLIDPPPPPSTPHPLDETLRAGVAAHSTIIDAGHQLRAQHAELVAAGRESEAADLAEILGFLADLEATFPHAVHSRRDRNEP